MHEHVPPIEEILSVLFSCDIQHLNLFFSLFFFTFAGGGGGRTPCKEQHYEKILSFCDIIIES